MRTPEILRRRQAPVFGGVALAVVAAAAAAGTALAVGGRPAPAHGAERTTTTTQAGTSTTTAPATTTTAPATTTTAARKGPPYAVASDTVTLVDPTRPSPARGPVPGSSSRTLRTVIRRPVGAAGPLPLLVFGHGFDVTPEAYETLLDAWAAAGYLVAAPDFPGSASDLSGPPTESDIAEQAGDLSFVISSLLGGRAGPVDPTRIAVAGHSDGGSSVVVLAENPAWADHRIAAYVVLAGQIPDGVPGPWDAATPGTLLCMVGSADQYGNLTLTDDAYSAARMAKAMVTVPGGDHEGIFDGTGAVPEEVRAATIRFLDAALGSARPLTDGQLATVLAPLPGSPAYQVATG